ncbi:OmpA family protein [Mucilaginibacter sp.]|uniref:OmpA family protein n=1 Tax=Mucilaginibacter sp. TaxID=1882438 RepID=UPI0025D98695|nr:OmpA family protein [Mucilaginibacter sp.]
MKNFKILIATIALGSVTQLSSAQILKPGEVAKEAGTSEVNNTETSAIDNGVSKASSAIKGLFKKKKTTPAPTAATNAPQALPPPTQAVQNNQPMQGTGSQQGPISAYNNYDFVPGDKIIFEDSFTDDDNGEFPAHWNLGAGQGVINTIAGRKALLLTDGNYAHVSPRIKSASYLGDPSTIEFDTYSNGGYPPKIYLYNTTANATAASGNFGVITIGNNDAQAANETGVELSGNYPAALGGENFVNKWHHVAIAFKKNQVKVYVDQYRVLVVPNLGTPHAIDIEGIGGADNPIILTNMRVASGGGMNMLGKKFTDAKLITHGINFDVDKATIKPESIGTLNMIVGILKDNPDLKFEVDGHTDNTGGAAHNATLSQQRADAVKTQLVSLGVDGSRLTTKGFGDTKPISDNLTLEGKANNRRVEFVKQ